MEHRWRQQPMLPRPLAGRRLNNSAVRLAFAAAFIAAQQKRLTPSLKLLCPAIKPRRHKYECQQHQRTERQIDHREKPLWKVVEDQLIEQMTDECSRVWHPHAEHAQSIFQRRQWAGHSYQRFKANQK